MGEFRFVKAGFVVPRPGDFAVISSNSKVGALVDVMESLSGGGVTQFSHACICEGIDKNGTVWIVEAMPQGAQHVPWHYADTEHLWSTGVVETSPQAGEKAMAYVGWGYGWADYAVLAARRFSLPFAPELQARYERTHTMICSQLVDQSELDAGVHLFADGRPAGYVRPSDLAGLVLEGGVS